MNSSQFQRVSKLVLAALDHGPDGRDAFLQAEGGHDTELLDEVRSLLAMEHADSPIDLTGGIDRAPTTAEIDPDRIMQHFPAQFGHYSLLRIIGTGGMGVVYEAQQENPKRTVALKLIRPGLMTRAMVSRLHHEARMLGQLNHIGIAHVYEAGTSPANEDVPGGPETPFIAMELVDGATITDYVRKHSLSIKERLELLLRLCSALEHAHQKGVIHRDLKPGNILVTDDGQPKVLDFGIARSTDADMQATTTASDSGRLLGTLPYMSPEQLAGDPSVIDTRSDVYAIGVVGYEMLTDQLPVPVIGMPITEAILAIRDQKPAPLGKMNPSLRGDLELIFEHVLDKDATQRYQSVSDFAADLSRFVNHQPILVRPHSAFYEFRKLVTRNKLPFASLAALVVVAVSAAIAMAFQARQIARQRDRAEQQARIARAVTDFLNDDILSQASPANQPDRNVPLRTVLDRASEGLEGTFPDDPLVESAIRITLADTYRSLSEYTIAASHAKRAVELRSKALGGSARETIIALHKLAGIYRNNGQVTDAAPVYQEAYRRARAALDPDDAVMLSVMNNFGLFCHKQGRFTEAEQLLEEVLQRQISIDGGDIKVRTLNTMNNLAMVYAATSRYAKAEELHSKELELSKQINGPEHPDTLLSMNNLAAVYRKWGKLDIARTMHEQILALRRRVLGDDHRDTLTSLEDLAMVAFKSHRLDDAERQFTHAIREWKRVFGPDHPRTMRARAHLAVVYYELNRFDEAIPILEEALAFRRRTLGKEHFRTAWVELHLAQAYVAGQRYHDAKELLVHSYDVHLATFGQQNADTRQAAAVLADLYQEQLDLR